jgi:hypothetical protein
MSDMDAWIQFVNLRVTCLYSRNYITKSLFDFEEKRNYHNSLFCLVVDLRFRRFLFTICDKYIVLNKYNQFFYVGKSRLDDMAVSLPNSQ